MKPVIGIIANHFLAHDIFPVHESLTHNSDAVAQVAGCIPILIPADPSYSSLDELMTLCDGFLFTGAPANVHPSEYGQEETPAHGSFDRKRDALTLPLIRALVDRGQPLLGICRGFQEIVVAMGGTLHPEIRDLPGRDNHRMPTEGGVEIRFAPRHDVHLTPGGVFANIFGAETVHTNTLHGQGLCKGNEHIVIDGHADDGTPEAIYVKDAKGLAIGVQWHPEYCAKDNPTSRALFTALGNAARGWRVGRV